MGKILSYSVTLDEDVVEEAKKLLEVGQKLSPVLNDLLKKWVEKKNQRNDLTSKNFKIKKPLELKDLTGKRKFEETEE